MRKYIDRGENMEKIALVICGLALLLLSSCNIDKTPPNDPDSLLLTVEIKEREVHSFEDLNIQLNLSNQSKINLLVQKDLIWRPESPVGMFAITIVILDSSGNSVEQFGSFVNAHPQGEDTLIVLESGKQLTTVKQLENGYHASDFKKGEIYTIFAIYQNSISVTKNINGVDVSSWVGSIRSNEETFTILPPR